MAVHGLLENLEAALPRKIAVNVATSGGPTAGEGDVFFESMYDAQNTPVALNETVIHRIGFRGRGEGPPQRPPEARYAATWNRYTVSATQAGFLPPSISIVATKIASNQLLPTSLTSPSARARR